MSAPTEAEIQAATDALVTDLTAGVQSASVDGQSATGMDPLARAKAIRDAAAAAALDGTNANGGAKSGWSRLRPARVVSPGPGDC